VKLSETPLAGAFVIELDILRDDRGFFARTFDAAAFREHGLEHTVVQCSASFNEKSGTLRGMHYQVAPNQECKLVRCTRGAIFDVIVDLRPDSDTYCRWFGIELTADRGRELYVPEDFAHGFQTLEDGSEVHYQISHEYVPANARGVRWDDPAFGIDWPPAAERTMSDKDRNYPDFRP
jgi:dTDP-4-dehydrorhamnose 3,5-epimerase